MRKCLYCGFFNQDYETICRQCGSSLSSGNLIASPLALPPNTSLLGGKFIVFEVLGSGGFGITYKARDTKLNRIVAVKEYFPNFCSTRQGKTVVSVSKSQDYIEGLRRFIDEAQLLARFNHPNIVHVYEYFQENNTAYIIMEFVEGQSLAKILESRRNISENEAINYALQICEALREIHNSNYLHRDIKPDNIIIKDGIVKLIDFGTARQFTWMKTSKMTTIITLGYAPLEQYSDKAKFGPYTDIYSLGATLYHMLTGEVPVTAIDRVNGVELKPPNELNRAVSKALSDLVMKMMEINAKQRPQNVEEVLNLLRGISLESQRVNKSDDYIFHKTTLKGKYNKIDSPFSLQPYKISPINFIGLHEDSIKSIAFHPTKPILATGYENKSIILWEIGAQVYKLRSLEHNLGLRSLAFSPDGMTLVAGGYNGIVNLWDVNTGLLKNTIDINKNTQRWNNSWINSISFSPDNELIALGCSRNDILIYDSSFDYYVCKLIGHKDSVLSVSFSPCGKILASGSSDGTIKVWSISNIGGNLLFTLPGHNGFTKSIAFSPDGKILASCGADFTIRIWDLTKKIILRTINSSPDFPISIAFSSYGEYIASVGYHSLVKIWRVSDGKLVKELSGHTKAINSVAFSPDGRFLASGSEDKTVRIWRLV